MSERISVIVPVYNAGRYLKPCIESLLQQTYPDIEILAVDDGSTDDSGAILDAYAKQDGRLSCIHQANAGVSAARNRGLDAATGDFISFLDSDDWLAPETYDVLLDTARREQVDAVFFEYFIDEPNGTSKPHRFADRWYGRLDNEALMRLVYGGACFCCTKLYRRKLVDGLRFRSDIYRGEDTIFAIEALHRAQSAFSLSEPYYHYVQSEGSAARGAVNARQMTGVDALKWMLDFADLHYPALHALGVQGYVNIMIELYYEMRRCGYRDDARKRQIVSEVKKYRKEVLQSASIRKKLKQKVRLFWLHPALFCFAADLKRSGKGGSL